MPKTEVIFFREEDGSCPLLEWLDMLPLKVQHKCIEKIERLSELGFELRRPEADYIKDGIYELRVAFQRVQYRILYFFHQGQAVLSHGLIKEDVIPPVQIGRVIKRKQALEKKPLLHTYEEEIE